MTYGITHRDNKLEIEPNNVYINNNQMIPIKSDISVEDFIRAVDDDTTSGEDFIIMDMKFYMIHDPRNGFYPLSILMTAFFIAYETYGFSLMNDIASKDEVMKDIYNPDCLKKIHICAHPINKRHIHELIRCIIENPYLKLPEKDCFKIGDNIIYDIINNSETLYDLVYKMSGRWYLDFLNHIRDELYKLHPELFK